MPNFEFPRTHPWAWTFLCFGVGAFPQWLSGIWALFSSEPLAVFISRNIDMSHLQFSPYWVTVPLGLLMFGYLIYILKKQKSPDAVTPSLRTNFSDAVAIMFEDIIGQRYYTWEIERENGQEVSVQRKSILLENHSGRDMENVTVKIERIIEENEQEPSPYLGYELRLEQNATRIRRDDRAWVPVFSYRKDKAPAWFSIDGVDTEASSKNGKLFRPQTKREVHLMVRADGGVATPAKFLVQVDSAGCLNMKRLTFSTLNSLKLNDPTDEFTSMKDAARKFYEAARAGKIPYGGASERLSRLSHGDSPSSGSPEDILHWWAGHISKHVPVYGRRPPSSVLEELPARDVRDFVFAEEATKLKDPMNDLIYYADLCVKRDALDDQYGLESGFHSQ